MNVKHSYVDLYFLHMIRQIFVTDTYLFQIQIIQHEINIISSILSKVVIYLHIFQHDKYYENIK